MTPPLFLASTSPYRRQLMEKLALPFDTCAVDTDETPLAFETAQKMVMRLAVNKAKAGAKGKSSGIIIGSDQAALLDTQILGKPLTVENAIKQLSSFSGRKITFYTALALYNLDTDEISVQCEPFSVHFKTLSEQQIRYYVNQEQPLYCAGSFKCEGLGIALFTKMEGRDPNALIGLPLILLTEMLLEFGVDVLNP
ncbi:Maf family nucleotide pyrophosphatase [Shewanella sp. AS1]|uniref:Maf family protein n=1 Tax=Shewanella sp. AS1 TaxID=2907626 RepID=UPI001F196629|nr:Maf family protein [Shewanella sp. AS1]MCE9678360.1 Maf family nucleotide pyrophosphatase [Shewanella sp. AS1]